MDQITKHKLDKACQAFVDAIDPVKVCELVTSFHPKNQSCHILGEWKKGSYNVCIPVQFDGDDGEKWMVRIPLLPRLAFPEEKMRSEIATMKYVAEKTTIPVPRIYGYSITGDNALGLPYLLLEYIEGNSLHGTKIQKLERTKRRHLYSQIADIYIQLYQQQFDRVGALTIGEDGKWVFGHNRPLSIDINEQELSGLEFCRNLPLDRTFGSTIDYVYMIVQLISNDFYRGRDCIIDKVDAQYYLYSIFSSRGILMEWVRPEYNHGPFVLIHGDLRPPNIITDDDLNIISVIDWEWSHTVPLQFLTPPSWLSDEGIQYISKDISSLAYLSAAYDFVRTARHHEKVFHNPNKLPLGDVPLGKFWTSLSEFEEFVIPIGLSAPHCFSNIYWDALDSRYFGKNREERIKAFFELDSRASDHEAIDAKMLQFEGFEKERQELGIENRPTIETKSREDLARLATELKRFGDNEDREINSTSLFDSWRGLIAGPRLGAFFCEDNFVKRHWLMVGLITLSTTYIISQTVKIR